MYGGYIVIKYLIDYGYKDIIIVILDDKSLKMYEDRIKGYLNVMEEVNLKIEVIKFKMDFEF